MKSTNERLAMVAADEWLQPVEEEINRRFAMYRERLEAIEGAAGRGVENCDWFAGC